MPRRTAALRSGLSPFMGADCSTAAVPPSGEETEPVAAEPRWPVALFLPGDLAPNPSGKLLP
jgi:hypothetical protein